jgi:ABC-type transport system substrate-binding protein
VLLGAVTIFGPLARPAAAQRDGERASIVIVTGQEATVPVPTLMEGPHASIANSDIADQLFLRLASLGPTLMTAGDRAFEPLLARRWERRDSVTLAFDLDPRATWHDGVPVTSEDVVFTFARARDPALSPRLAALLRRITSVTAEDTHRVVFRFSEAYAEQMYDAVFHVAPLPAHLLARIPPDRLAGFKIAFGENRQVGCLFPVVRPCQHNVDIGGDILNARGSVRHIVNGLASQVNTNS